MMNNKRRNPFQGGQAGRQAPYVPTQPQQPLQSHPLPPTAPGAPQPQSQPQPQQYDWSSYWSQAAAGYPQPHGAQPTWGTIPSQPGVQISAPPQPAAPPPPPVPIPVPPPSDPRFANYGYGNVNYGWSRHGPPPAAPPFQQPYPPQPTSVPPPPPPHPSMAPQPFGQPYVQHPMIGPQQPYFNHQQPPIRPNIPQPPPIHMTLNHPPPQNLPPAKRPRFEPPSNSNLSGPAKGPRQPVPPRPPPQHPSPNVQTPAGNGPISLPGTSHMGSAAPASPGGRGRGALQNGPSAPTGPFNRGRGGMTAGGGGGRGGMRGGMLGRGNNSMGGAGRGGFVNGARSTPRGPSHRHQTMAQRFHHGNSASNGNASTNFARSPLGPSAPSRGRAFNRDGTPRRDDAISAKRTLTDFRIIGVECSELSWSWGKVAVKTDSDSKTQDSPVKVEDDLAESAGEKPSESSLAPKKDEGLPPKPDLPPPPRSFAPHQSETSRIRFYFQSPIELEDVRPGRVWGSAGVGGKRKKEYDEGEPDGQEGGKRIKESDENEGSVVGLIDSSHSDGATEVEDTLKDAALTDPDVTGTAGGIEVEDSVDADSDALQPDEVDPASLQRPHSAPEALLHRPYDLYDPDDDTTGSYMAPSASQSDLDAVFSSLDEENGHPISTEDELSTIPVEPDTPSETHDTEATRDDPTDSPPQVKSEPDPVLPTKSTAISSRESTPPTSTTFTEATLPVTNGPHSPTKSAGTVTSTTSTKPVRDASPPEKPTSATTLAPSSQSPELDGLKGKPKPVARSPDRISISYAGSSRRLVLDADVVEKVKIWRAEGRIELTVVVQRESDEEDDRKTAKVQEVDSKQSEESSVGVSDPKGDDEIDSVSGAGNNLKGNSAAVEVKQEVIESTDGKFEEATAEVDNKPEKDTDLRCRGILASLHVEAFSETSQSYVPHLQTSKLDIDDSTMPPFTSVLQCLPKTVTFIAHLDREKPLSEPKWVRTGDIDEWLRGIYGHLNTHDEAGRALWTGRIEVVDPDPPPTIHTVLESWSANSPVGLAKDRRRFLKEHMSSSIDNILEILLRLVRGERASHHPNQHSHLANSPLNSPLASAISSPNAPHAAQQTHVSLAVLAIFRMSAEYAERAGEESGKVEERVGEIVRALPQHLIYKSLDGIFREWSGSGGFTGAFGHNGTNRKPGGR